MNLKLSGLKNILLRMKEVVVAYSGGVDSTFLLKIALDTLGNDNVLAAIASSPTFPASEKKEAVDLAIELGAKYRIIETNEFDDDSFRKNPKDRCYHCKKELFSQLAKLTKLSQLTQPTQQLIDGSNLDDLNDYRPGTKAKEELGVRSPLQEAGLSKSEIRELSRELGLKTWDKPALACLASRIPYGTEITLEALKMIDQAEDSLRNLGFRQNRVRHFGRTARIEVEKDSVHRFLDGDLMKKVNSEIGKAGYLFVSIDTEGYRTGSMNEGINGTHIS